MSDIKARIINTPECEPDMIDAEIIDRIRRANDTDDGISLDEMDRLRTTADNNTAKHTP